MFDRLPIRRRVVVVVLPVLLALLVGIGVFLASRDDTGSVEPAPAWTTSPDENTGGGAGADSSGSSGIGGAPASTAPAGDRESSDPDTTSPADRIAARRAERAYRDYIDAINARDGAKLCGLIAPGFERALRPPRSRGRCAKSIQASIGYSDPRGFPVWEQTILAGVQAVQLSGEASKARLTADVVTRFADRSEPSVESDIAYLVAGPRGWRLAKASGALYRAVGKPDFPPRVISPP